MAFIIYCICIFLVFFLGVISLQLDELPVDFFLDINPQKNVVYLLFQVKMLYCIHHLLLKKKNKSKLYIFSHCISLCIWDIRFCSKGCGLYCFYGDFWTLRKVWWHLIWKISPQYIIKIQEMFTLMFWKYFLSDQNLFSFFS